MIREVLGAPQTLLFAGMPDEQERSLRFVIPFREGLGDLEQRHRTRAIVVGAIVDRVATRLVDLSKTVENDANLRALLGSRRTILIILAARAHDGVEGTQRVVIDRVAVEPDVIVV